MTTRFPDFATATLLAVALLFCTQSADASRTRPTRDERKANSGPRIERPAALEQQLTAEDRAAYAKQIRIALARRYAAKKDILNWGRMLFPDKFSLPFCDLHRYLVEIRGEEFTGTTAPRWHSKTTIQCFLIPIFQALEEPDRYRHYLNIQETSAKAVTVNTAIRAEIEQNEILRAIYGDQVSSDKWTDAQFVLRNSVIFSALGAGQSIRGINYRNIRPEYILADDLYDTEEIINNPEATTKVNRWFWGALYPARSVSSTCCIHVQGTAVNEHDILKALENDDTILTKLFRQIEGYGTAEARILWPELNNLAAIDRDKKRMGVLWYREMQNERRGSDEAKIQPGALIPYDPAGLGFDADHILVSVELGVDPSIGATLGSDFTGIVAVLKTRHKDAEPGVYNYYIDGIWNERLSMNERVKLCDRIRGQYQDRGLKIKIAHIEGIAGFKDFVSEVKRRTALPVHEVSSVKDKITNLENKSVYFENGRVFISSRIPQSLRDALDYQLSTNKPANDDIRDALLLVLPPLTVNSPWRPV